MSYVDSKNKYLIYKYVKDYFSLDEKSLKLFKNRLLYERLIPKEYQEILNNSKDLRVRKEIPIEFKSRIDEGWSIFQQRFILFCAYNDTQYEEFHNNSFSLKGDKNKYKISKALKKFYESNESVAMENFIQENISALNELKYKNLNLSSFKELFRSHLFDISKMSLRQNPLYLRKVVSRKIIDSFLDPSFSGRDVRFFISGEKVTISKDELYHNNGKVFFNLHIDNFVDNIHFDNEFFESYISEQSIYFTKDRIDIFIHEINDFKLPKSKTEIVFSLNYADWFLASTKEDWTSCISLESSYEENYWTGLPGLITDKNRAMIYITDGKKKNYNGIEVDRIISRTWLLLARAGKGKDSENFLAPVRDYPHNYNLPSIMKDLLGIDYINERVAEYKSKYYVESIYHSNGMLSFVYNDTVNIYYSNKNKGKIFPKEYIYFKSGAGGRKFLNKYEDDNVNYFYDEEGVISQGLTDLINIGVTLEEFKENTYIEEPSVMW